MSIYISFTGPKCLAREKLQNKAKRKNYPAAQQAVNRGVCKKIKKHERRV